MTGTLSMAGVVLLWLVGGGGQEWVGGPDFFTLDAVTPTVPNSESNAGATADKALDGSGLDPTGAMHDKSGYVNGRLWLGEVTNEPHGDGTGLPNPGTYSHESQPGWFRVDFDRVYELTFARIWNGNEGNATNRGMNQVVVEYSATGGPEPADWARLGGPDAVHGFPRAAGSGDYTGFDLDFDGAEAKAVVFTAETSDRGVANFGNTGNIALSELRFYISGWACAPGDANSDSRVNDDDLILLLANWTGPVVPDSAAIPEPASAALTLLGASPLARRRRRPEKVTFYFSRA